MASNPSFDITSEVDLQEVDNAVNQATKEVSQRYDFKGGKADIEFNRKDGVLLLDADSSHRLEALSDVLRGKIIKRGVPLKNLDWGKIEDGSLGSARQTVTLTQGIPTDKAKEIVRAVKDMGLRKVQAQIQDQQVRVTAPSIDDLQRVIATLKVADFGVELQFGNFRS